MIIIGYYARIEISEDYTAISLVFSFIRRRSRRTHNELRNNTISKGREMYRPPADIVLRPQKAKRDYTRIVKWDPSLNEYNFGGRPLKNISIHHNQIKEPNLSEYMLIK